MPLFYQNGKLLRFGGTLQNCCCDQAPHCCCDNVLTRDLVGTFGSDGACGAYLDGRVVTLVRDHSQENATICAAWIATVTPAETCGGIVVPFQVKIRCNTALSDRGGGLCDKYEVEITYQSSPCTSTAGIWTRVNSGCTCDPLNAVFTLPAPSNSGLGGAGCNCCTNPTVTFTVT